MRTLSRDFHHRIWFHLVQAQRNSVVMFLYFRDCGMQAFLHVGKKDEMRESGMQVGQCVSKIDP